MQDYSLPPEAQEEPALDTFKPSVNNNAQDGHAEIVDRRQLISLSDTECKHDSYIRDETDETEEYYSMVCSNDKCPVGYLVSKQA